MPDRVPSRKTIRQGGALIIGLVLMTAWLSPDIASGQTVPPPPAADQDLSEVVDVDQWLAPDRISGTVKTVLLLAVISLAPAIALMTTSFVRIVIVLGILRQAIGAQQIPSTQIVTALSLFMSLLIMTPVWHEVKTSAIDPYTSGETEMSLSEAWELGSQPVKAFMTRQIAVAGNIDDIWLFWQYLPESQRGEKPQTYDDIPIQVLLPAFMISELKIAFMIGFQIFMPFLVIDLVVTSVTTSMGMIMLPPTMVSLPLKLIMFVLADGWHLVVGMLMQSFTPYM
ncbi:MAG: flagellar type III secretion system pore protein FliP [Pirellulaceae bacterium]